MHRHLITNLGNSIGENIEYLLNIGAISSVDEGCGISVLWRDILKKRNMTTAETDLDVKDLFSMLNHVFNIEYRTNRPKNALTVMYMTPTVRCPYRITTHPEFMLQNIMSM